MEKLKRFHADESGQDLIEYALILAAVVLATVAGSNTLSGSLSMAVSRLDSKVVSAFN